MIVAVIALSLAGVVCRAGEAPRHDPDRPDAPTSPEPTAASDGAAQPALSYIDRPGEPDAEGTELVIVDLATDDQLSRDEQARGVEPCRALLERRSVC